MLFLGKWPFGITNLWNKVYNLYLALRTVHHLREENPCVWNERIDELLGNNSIHTVASFDMSSPLKRWNLCNEWIDLSLTCISDITACFPRDSSCASLCFSSSDSFSVDVSCCRNSTTEMKIRGQNILVTLDNNHYITRPGSEYANFPW